MINPAQPNFFETANGDDLIIENYAEYTVIRDGCGPRASVAHLTRAEAYALARVLITYAEALPQMLETPDEHAAAQTALEALAGLTG